MDEVEIEHTGVSVQLSSAFVCKDMLVSKVPTSQIA